MSYAEGFNVDLMHQGDQKVEQYTKSTRYHEQWSPTSLKMSPTASQYISRINIHYTLYIVAYTVMCEDGQIILNNGNLLTASVCGPEDVAGVICHFNCLKAVHIEKAPQRKSVIK